MLFGSPENRIKSDHRAVIYRGDEIADTIAVRVYSLGDFTLGDAMAKVVASRVPDATEHRIEPVSLRQKLRLEYMYHVMGVGAVMNADSGVPELQVFPSVAEQWHQERAQEALATEDINQLIRG